MNDAKLYHILTIDTDKTPIKLSKGIDNYGEVWRVMHRLLKEQYDNGNFEIYDSEAPLEEWYVFDDGSAIYVMMDGDGY